MTAYEAAAEAYARDPATREWNQQVCHAHSAPCTEYGCERPECVDESIAVVARRELMDECARDGTIAHAAYLDFLSEFGPCSPAAFVANLEGVDSCVWSDKTATIRKEMQ